MAEVEVGKTHYDEDDFFRYDAARETINTILSRHGLSAKSFRAVCDECRYLHPSLMPAKLKLASQNSLSDEEARELCQACRVIEHSLLIAGLY